MFWCLAAIYILFEGPGIADGVIHNPHGENASWVPRIRFSPDGRFLVSGLGTDVALLDPRKGEVLGRRQIRNELTAMAFSHDSRVLVLVARPQLGTTNGSGERAWESRWVVPHDALLGEVQVLDVSDAAVGPQPALRQRFPAEPRCRCDPSSIAFSPDDRSVMVGTLDGSGLIWKMDLASGDFKPALRAYGDSEGRPSRSGGIDDLGYTRDGRILATLGLDASGSAWTCRTWDAATLRLERSFAITEPGSKSSGFLVAEADSAISFDASGRALVWDLTTGTRRAHIGGPTCHRGWNFAPDGNAFAVSCGTRLEVLAFPSFAPLATAAPWHRWPLPVPPRLALSSQGLVAGTDAEYPSNGRDIYLWRRFPPWRLDRPAAR